MADQSYVWLLFCRSKSVGCLGCNTKRHCSCRMRLVVLYAYAFAISTLINCDQNSWKPVAMQPVNIKSLITGLIQDTDTCTAIISNLNNYTKSHIALQSTEIKCFQQALLA